MYPIDSSLRVGLSQLRRAGAWDLAELFLADEWVDACFSAGQVSANYDPESNQVFANNRPLDQMLPLFVRLHLSPKRRWHWLFLPYLSRRRIWKIVDSGHKSDQRISVGEREREREGEKESREKYQYASMSSCLDFVGRWYKECIQSIKSIKQKSNSEKHALLGWVWFGFIAYQLLLVIYCQIYFYTYIKVDDLSLGWPERSLFKS